MTTKTEQTTEEITFTLRCKREGTMRLFADLDTGECYRHTTLFVYMPLAMLCTTRFLSQFEAGEINPSEWERVS